MADTKISALTGASALGSTDEFPVNQGATSKKATANQIAQFAYANVNAPVISPGSATAGSWPKFSGSGTLLTTAEDGAIEMDADCFYLTTDAGNRGVVPVRHIIRADTTRTFTSNTSAQSIFSTPTNGRLTLEAGTYLFDGLLVITGMSATSGNVLIDILGAGTATIGSWLWVLEGLDASSPSGIASDLGVYLTSSGSAASCVTAGTGTAIRIRVKGTFEVTGAGTIIPSSTMVTAAASILSVGSYLMFERIGSTTMTSVGQWD